VIATIPPIFSEKQKHTPPMNTMINPPRQKRVNGKFTASKSLPCPAKE
jgi:hypothetical protein